jgi:succinate dehydrogenase/fumarate reductase flavoprotein subunit
MSGVLDHRVPLRIELEPRHAVEIGAHHHPRAMGGAGPLYDAKRRMIDVFTEPIPRLYAINELGSPFGYLYLSGASVAECFVTGRIAECNVAAAKPWR